MLTGPYRKKALILAKQIDTGRPLSAPITVLSHISHGRHFSPWYQSCDCPPNATQVYHLHIKQNLLQYGPPSAMRIQDTHSTWLTETCLPVSMRVWTDEELNLLSYLRTILHWTSGRIQKLYFPSRSTKSVAQVYKRVPKEDRLLRASVVRNLVDTPPGAPSRTAADDRLTHYISPGKIRCCPHYCLSSRGKLRIRRDVRDSVLLPSNPGEGSETTAPGSSRTTRYNLRPNRPTVFRERNPRYLADRRRFPHFCQSYRRHLRSHTLPDSDYTPHSRSPTPDSSDRSPSIISTQLSEASSTQLFGLESRSPAPRRDLACESSTTASEVDDESSLEFFSAEESLSTP